MRAISFYQPVAAQSAPSRAAFAAGPVRQRHATFICAVNDAGHQRDEQHSTPPHPLKDAKLLRREALLTIMAAGAAQTVLSPSAAHAVDDFITTPSGLRYQDIKIGEGESPSRGSYVSVHWSGYTKGYQGKRIDNTSVRDDPFSFKLGGGQAIAAFEEAVSTMKPGGIRRIEVPGEHPELGYSRDRSQRFTGELYSPDTNPKIFKYRLGPQPAELGGQRALDFVLDNATLQDFNRTLLFDIKLLTVRK